MLHRLARITAVFAIAALPFLAFATPARAATRSYTSTRRTGMARVEVDPDEVHVESRTDPPTPPCYESGDSPSYAGEQSCAQQASDTVYIVGGVGVLVVGLFLWAALSNRK